MVSDNSITQEWNDFKVAMHRSARICGDGQVIGLSTLSGMAAVVS